VYGLTNVTAMFVGFFLMPLYTGLFSVSDYGAIELITIINQVIVLIAGLQVESGVARYYYECKNDFERKKLISSGLLLKLIVPAVFCLILLPWIEEISLALFNSTLYKRALLISLFTIPVSTIWGYFLLLFRLQMAKKIYVFLATGTTIIMFLCCIYFVAYLHLGIEGVFGGYFLSYIIFAVIGFGLSRKSFAFTFSLPLTKYMLAYSVPIIPATLVSWLRQYIDRFLLIPLVGLHGIGLYSAAMKVSSIILLVITAFQLAWLPFSMSLITKEGHKEVFSKIFTYFVILLSLAALIVTIFSKEILQLLTPATYWDAYILIGFLAGSFVLNGAFIFVSIGLSIVKKTYLNTVSFLGGTTLGIVFLFILTPRIGIIGAAIAALASSAITLIIGYFLAQRNYYINYEWKKVVIIFLAFLVFIPVTITINKNITGAMNIIIKLFEVIIFLMCIFKSLPKEEISDAFSLIKRKIKSLVLSFNVKYKEMKQ
jgi:O-antigen/teichoic acid export membrane protein